ncbi:MAG: mechanosensitive ion channel family protein [Clostridia bacterium]|nr:mechanosensitive ion channel family protein [Clostridia bacterium]
MEKVINFLGTFFDINVFSITRLILAVVIFVAFFILKSLLARVIIRIFGVKGKENIRSNSFYRPLKLLFISIGLYAALLTLGPTEMMRSFVNKAFRVILIILGTYAVANLVAPGSKFEKAITKKMTKANDSMIRMICKFLKIFVYIVGVMVIISELGFNINGIIAGIGIGSAALALAAQDTASNIIGAFMIMIDKPFEVGEWIKVDTIEGAVEEFTFRSTRIRESSNSVVAIPNSTIVNSSIINWSRLQKRRISIDLTLEFDTSLKKVADVQNDLLILLENEPNIIKDSLYVKFNEIKANGYNLKVFCYTPIINYMDYMDYLNTINFKIMHTLNNHKVNLAFNSQSIYLKR